MTKSEAAAAGIDLKFADAQQKQENQIKAIRGFIAQGVDAILVAPVVATGWEEVLTEANEASIPVVLLDRGIEGPEDLYLTSVASDQVKEGRVAGEWPVGTVGEKQCNVVELQGTVGSSAAINCKKGFEEALAGKSNLAIIRSQTGDFTRSKGKEVMDLVPRLVCKGAGAGRGTATRPAELRSAQLRRTVAVTRGRDLVMAGQETAPVLQARGIVKVFGQQRALDNVDFTARAGEVHALPGKPAPASRRSSRS